MYRTSRYIDMFFVNHILTFSQRVHTIVRLKIRTNQNMCSTKETFLQFSEANVSELLENVATSQV